MKKIFLYAFLVSILFAQCTPKTGETMTKAPETNVEVPDVKVEVPKAPTFRSIVPPAGPAPRIQMGAAEEFTLENGLKVILVENHKLPRVSYQLFVDVPALKETDKSGTIEIAGDMLNKGTTSKSKSEIDESIDFIGANLSTNPNGMFGAALKKYNEELLAIISDVLLNPSFPEAEFDKIKKQYASGLAQDKDDPSSLSRNLANRVVYGADHPYGEFMTEATLENITLEGIKSYYQKWFKPNTAYLIVVGDITKAEAEPLAKQYFSKWKADDKLTSASPEMPKAPIGNEVDFINKSGAVQSVISVTYPVDLQPGTPDVIKASVMNTLLGAGVYFGNRLNQNLRETNAYTYGARSNLSSDRYVGSFSAGASVRNEVTDSSIVEIFNEMNTIRTEKVDEAELQKVKNVLGGSFGRSLESPQTIARFALNTARYNLPKDYYATYLEKLAAVTSDDLMAMAKKYIKPENAHIVVVGNQDDVATKLKRFAKSGAVQYYNKNYEKIEMLKVTIPEGTTAISIIDDYLKAIGGATAMDNVKSIATVMKGNIMGQNIDMEIYQKMPGQYAMLTLMGGTVVNAEVLNGDKGLVSGMTGPKMADGADLKDLREKAVPFRERTYEGSSDYKIELGGIEEVEGRPAFKVKITSATGSKTTDFYDTTSKLKVRSIISREVDGQAMVQTVEIGDYKEIKGVMFPHRLVISGGGIPMPLELKAASVKVNEEMDESVFNVE
ncbi:MAG: zinc protease [Polaribacter sp.]|jgi:zinc protease